MFRVVSMRALEGCRFGLDGIQKWIWRGLEECMLDSEGFKGVCMGLQ